MLAERNDAETFYISSILKSGLAAEARNIAHPRYDALMEKHGLASETIPISTATTISKLTLKSKLIHLKITIPSSLSATGVSIPTEITLAVLPSLATRLLRTKIAKAIGRPVSELGKSRWQMIGYLKSTRAEESVEDEDGRSNELRFEIPLNEEGRELTWWGLEEGDRIELMPGS